jgi:hypothetical protein
MSSQLVSNIAAVALVALPLFAGCVSMPSSGSVPQRIVYGPEDFARIRDSVSGTADAAGGQPRVRIIVPSTMGADRYVDATIRVSEDAYVLVVASDLDGRARVIFPASPEESGFVSAAAPHRLSRFFAGFGALGSTRYGRSAFSVEPVSRFTPRGAMVAVASDRPLQLAKITDANGDWDEAAIERLMYGRAVTSAGYAIGRELSLAGQEFDADYSGFTRFGNASLYSVASVGSALCESEFTGALYYDAPRPTTFFERNGERYAVITSGDACSGYQTRTVPAGPAIPRVPRDSADSARVRGVDPRFAERGANSAGAGRFGSTALDATVPRARRGTETNALRPVDRPNIIGGLRFRPPERLRAEPRLRESNGGTIADEERARRRLDAAERGRRPTPVYEERTRQTPARSEPAAVREAPRPAQPATPVDAPSGKPRKE